MTQIINASPVVPSRDLAGLKRSAPLLTLLGLICLLPLALLVTIPQPIGALLWDLYIYLDGANRILSGQIPSVDFFAPVGALGYYLFTLAISVFPNGHPLLLSAWSLLLVSAPLMAVVVLDVQRRSTGLAFALLGPFLLYSLLPFNLGGYYPFPGSEGFGIYNRQVCQLLYVLAAALVFVDNRRRLCGVVAAAMLALFFVKVTGAIAGALLCLMALGAGRLGLRLSLLAATVFLAVLGVLQITLGLTSAYIGNILALLAVNTETLLPRMLKAGSFNIGACLAAALLCLTLLVINRADLRARLSAALSAPSRASLSAVVDQSFVWIGAFLAAGLLFESQNTGSQALIFLWPLLLKVALDQYGRSGPSRNSGVVAMLVLAVALPPVVSIVQKASRAWIGMAENVPMEHHNLKTIGAFSAKPLFAERAQRMETVYAEHRDLYAGLASVGEPASVLLFSDFDFQWGWLRHADAAISAVLAYEAARDIRFETMMTIDFVNPFPWLMDRRAPEHIAIGADPTRAVPAPNETVLSAIRSVDIALLPTCPITPTQTGLLGLYETAFRTTHTRATLTPCFDAFLRNDLVNPR